MSVLFFILGIPLLLAFAPAVVRRNKLLGIINAAGYSVILGYVITLLPRLEGGGVSFLNFFYVDILSGFFILTISVVNVAASLYSIDYIDHDVRGGEISGRKSRTYYVLFNVFAFSMYLVTVLDNMGILWVAIEMTTLASGFLVGFYNTKKSIEAAWKYVIICSVGITLALFGTILLYYTVSVHGGIKSLNWTDMLAVARELDPRIMKIAFLFILVGYGTKAGLAPMHTWLPDAHSQALTPVSAMLSGVLLKTAIFAIIRFTIVLNRCVGPEFSGNLLVFFGLLSLGISAAFILIQKDIKRLLAYSSIEHIGIISVGLGIGGPLAVYGALLHVFNHAVTKPLMFFGAGNIVKKYRTNNMNLIRGVIKAMPFTGVLVIIGAFALAGSPPFSLFISEILVLASGFLKGSFTAAVLLLLFLSVIFGAILHHFSRIIFGKKPEDMPVTAEPLSGKLAFLFLFAFIIVFGIFMPSYFDKVLTLSAELVLIK